MGVLFNDVERLIRGLLPKNDTGSSDVEPGETYEMVHGNHMVETAEVIAIKSDIHGIPHVRYHVSFRRPHRTEFDGGARMLALQTFNDRYQRVAG